MATRKKILKTIVNEINTWFEETAKEVRDRIDENFFESEASVTPEEREQEVENPTEVQYEYGDCRCCGGSGDVYDDGNYKEECWECKGTGFQTDPQDFHNVQRQEGQHDEHR